MTTTSRSSTCSAASAASRSRRKSQTLWPTIRSSAISSTRKPGTGGKCLAEEAAKMWPTARTTDAAAGRKLALNFETGLWHRENAKGNQKYGANLSDLVLLPSPTPKSNPSPAPSITGTFPIRSALAPSRMLHAMRCLRDAVASRLSLLAGSRASRTPAPVSGSPAPTTATCGASVGEFLGNFDPSMRCSRTSAACLQANRDFFSTAYCRTWPTSGILVSGRLYRLPPLERPTDESGSGCCAGTNGQEQPWPTPTSRDHKDGSAEACANVPENGLLGRTIHRFAGPPSTAHGPAAPASRSTDGSRQGLWATPVKQDSIGARNATSSRPENSKHHSGETLCDQTLPTRNGKVVGSAKLNPHWVMCLMGYPPLWAEIGRKFTTGSRNSRVPETPSCPPAPPSSSTPSLAT